jgi:hypothetical protein
MWRQQVGERKQRVATLSLPAAEDTSGLHTLPFVRSRLAPSATKEIGAQAREEFEGTRQVSAGLGQRDWIALAGDLDFSGLGLKSPDRL